MKSGNFSALLLPWYDLHKRDLPWRQTRNPYFIWLSEVILQQTRVDQGMTYYQKITSAYPTVQELASANVQEVLNHWQGLGYYSRARNLHAAAKMVVNEFGGKFPQLYEELLMLPGVGPYTAGAVASISSDQVVPVVDGNVYRVLSRVFNIHTPINSSDGQKQFLTLAAELLDQKRPGDFNQAVMELGALICKPSSPSCSSCPLSNICQAREKNTARDLPVKLSKKAPKNLWLNYFVVVNSDQVLIRKRTENGIWQNLYDFPCLESDIDLSEKVVLDQMSAVTGVPDEVMTVTKLLDLKHLLTHRRIHATFYLVEVESTDELPSNFRWIPSKTFGDFPIPRLIENFWIRWSEESSSPKMVGDKNA